MRHPIRAATLLLLLLTTACDGEPVGAPSGGAVTTTVSYGDGPEAVADLRVPAGAGPHPVVVVIHGGFWRERYRRDLMTPLAEDLTVRGYATWNIEYRRVGGGGGWPHTFEDVAAAVDHLADLGDAHGLDLGRVITLGHSAGGQLAVWAAGREQLAVDAPGSAPQVVPCGAVSLAGVLDLRTAAIEGVGGSAVLDLLGGGPDEVPERYAMTSPIESTRPVRSLLVHGVEDAIVPSSQSEDYYERFAGDSELVTPPRTDHFAVIDPTSQAWSEVIARLATLCPP